MPKTKILSDRYLLAIIVISLLLSTFWVSYGHFLYSNYLSMYYDIGISTYAAYWHLHPGNWDGILQYLVIGNHLSPFWIAILPIFALHQEPITLLIIQDFGIALTATAVYLICRDLLKNRRLSFVLAIAFLINPGIGGILAFDFHIEAFLPLFLILAFYFYMKEKRGYFFLSYVLLLSVIEEAPFVGGSLLAALLLYELLYRNESDLESRSKRRKRMGMLASGIFLTLAFLLVYYEMGSILVASYPNTPYSVISPSLWYGNFLSHNPVNISTSSGQPINLLDYLYAGLILGMIIVVTGFGISSMANPIISLILYSPWLALILIVGYLSAAYPYYQYYAFVVGGSLIAAILGFMIISKGRAWLPYLNKHYDIKRNEPFISTFTFSYALILSIFIFSGLSGILLSAHPKLADAAQLNRLLATIPQNSSIMAESNIAAHLFYVRNLELIPISYNAPITTESNVGETPFWFAPEYIILDTSFYFTNPQLNRTLPGLLNYTRENYTLTYNQSGIMLFKRN